MNGVQQQKIDGQVSAEGEWVHFQCVLGISVEATRPSVSGNGNIMVSIKTMLVCSPLSYGHIVCS
jgi:hypothetical protein